jgi:hypothetical protein
MPVGKDAYWFPHDANARNDPAICAMRKKYKSEGYGWYWMLVEMMREQSDYRLMLGLCDGYAMQMQCTSTKASEFIADCIAPYGLFKSDGESFWSGRLMREMEFKAGLSETRRKAALAMHEKRQSSTCSANAEQKQSTCMPIQYSTVQDNTVQNEKNDSPDGESGARKTTTFKPPTVEEVAKYCRERCNSVVAQQWHDHYTSNGWMVGKNKMKDWKAAVRTWEKNRDDRRNDKDFADRNYSNQRPNAAATVKFTDVASLDLNEL